MVEMVFISVLAEWDSAEAGGRLPVLDTACFANWLFQKSSFFIWELTGVLCRCLQKISEEFRSMLAISFSHWSRIRLRRFPIYLTQLSATHGGRLARRDCRRSLHPFPVIAVFGTAMDADLVISAIGSFQWPRKAVGAAKQQFT